MVSTLCSFCALNCEKYKNHVARMAVVDPEMVPGYPTIIFYKGGVPIAKYQGPRTQSDILLKAMEVCGNVMHS